MMYSPLFFATVALAQITLEQKKELSTNTDENNAGKATWADYLSKWGDNAVDENTVKERAVLPTLGEKLPAPAPAPKTMTTPPELKAEKINAPEPATKMVYGAKSSNQNQQANKGLKKAKGNPPKGEPEAPVKPEVPVPEVPVKHDMPEKMETKSADMKKVGFYTESIKDYLSDEADLDTFFKEIKVATNEKYQKDPEMQMRYKNAEDNASKLGEQYKFWKHYKNGKFSATLMNALKKEYKDFFV